MVHMTVTALDNGVLYIVALTVLVLLWPFSTYWIHNQDRGTQSNHCVDCGYSLAGLPRAGRCPECGRLGAGTTSRRLKGKYSGDGALLIFLVVCVVICHESLCSGIWRVLYNTFLPKYSVDFVTRLISGFDFMLAHATLLVGMLAALLSETCRIRVRLALAVCVPLAFLVCHAALAWVLGARTWRTYMLDPALNGPGVAYEGSFPIFTATLVMVTFVIRVTVSRLVRDTYW